jgi:hypothetical protein
MDHLLVERALPLVAHEQYASEDPFVERFHRLAGVVGFNCNRLIEQTALSSDRSAAWLAGDVFEMRPSTRAQVSETKVTAMSRSSESNRDVWTTLSAGLKGQCQELIDEALAVIRRWQAGKGLILAPQDLLVCAGIRILRYPPNPRVQARTVHGDLLPGHVDESAVTLLLPGGGLQVWRNAWCPVTPNHIQLLIGGRFPDVHGFRVEPTPHRVVPASSGPV